VLDGAGEFLLDLGDPADAVVADGVVVDRTAP
jgi:hypothetical protein